MKNCPIIYENEEIIIINKAAGIAVQGGEGVAHPLDEELSQACGYRVHLVHRLDKETSGLLIVAKSAASAAKWIALVASKQVRKEYTAMCFNVPIVGGKPLAVGESATIRAPVEKGGRSQDAVTHVTLMRSWTHTVAESGEEPLTCSLLRLVLGTGRMHQIRIHLARAKSPIVGDDKHGDFKRNKRARKLLGAHKLMLAATTLAVPIDGALRRFTVPLPEHIAALQATLAAEA